MSDTERIEEFETEQEGVEVQLSPEVITQIAVIASEMAIKAVRKEEQEAFNRRKRQLHKKLSRALNSYRTMKKVIAQKKYSKIEEMQLRWRFMEDLMGDSIHGREPDSIIEEENRRMQENEYAIFRIDNALKLYEEDVAVMRNDEKTRRLEVLKMRYIYADVLPIEEIAQRAEISEKTVYRDIGVATDMLAIYMGWGMY